MQDLEKIHQFIDVVFKEFNLVLVSSGYYGTHKIVSIWCRDQQKRETWNTTLLKFNYRKMTCLGENKFLYLQVSERFTESRALLSGLLHNISWDQLGQFQTLIWPITDTECHIWAKFSNLVFSNACISEYNRCVN